MRDAVRAALDAAPALSGIHRIGDGDGEAAPVPHIIIGEALGSDWGAKDRAGRELRLGITIVDRGPAARIDAMAAAAEAALTGLPRIIDGWETSGVVVTRTRRLRRRDGASLALIDLRLRGLRTA